MGDVQRKDLIWSFFGNYLEIPYSAYVDVNGNVSQCAGYE